MQNLDNDIKISDKELIPQVKKRYKSSLSSSVQKMSGRNIIKFFLAYKIQNSIKMFYSMDTRCSIVQSDIYIGNCRDEEIGFDIG